MEDSSSTAGGEGSAAASAADELEAVLLADLAGVEYFSDSDDDDAPADALAALPPLEAFRVEDVLAAAEAEVQHEPEAPALAALEAALTDAGDRACDAFVRDFSELTELTAAFALPAPLAAPAPAPAEDAAAEDAADVGDAEGGAAEEPWWIEERRQAWAAEARRDAERQAAAAAAEAERAASEEAQRAAEAAAAALEARLVACLLYTSPSPRDS